MNYPPLIPVDSSQIESVAYDSETETLWVKFHRGGLYSYTDVLPGVFRRFMAAPSLGRFLGQEIKGKHEFTKHTPPPEPPTQEAA